MLSPDSCAPWDGDPRKDKGGDRWGTTHRALPARNPMFPLGEGEPLPAAVVKAMLEGLYGREESKQQFGQHFAVIDWQGMLQWYHLDIAELPAPL